MAENKVKDGNYYVVQSFMVKDLKLKGLEKDVYAIIYGFSQAENQTFTGSLQYFADWTNSTKQGIIKTLNSLIEKGLIGKKENTINNIKFVEYYTTEFNGGSQLSLMGGSQLSLPNNINNDNINDNIDNIAHSKQVASEPALYKIQLNDNSYFEITQSFYDELKPLYPNVDLDNEFRQMISWTIGNPKRRKTKSGIKKFITSWLSREQDKGTVYQNRQQPKSSSFNNFTQREYSQGEMNNIYADLDNVKI